MPVNWQSFVSDMIAEATDKLPGGHHISDRMQNTFSGNVSDTSYANRKTLSTLPL